MSTFSECVNNFEFIFNPLNVRFDTADSLCRQQGARLTIPRSVDWFNEFGAFLTSIDSPTVWVGLSDFDDVGGSFIATRFLDIERRPNPFTAVAQVEPWSALEPDDADGNQNCVETDSDGLLSDVSCNLFNPFVCERYCGELPDNFVFDECLNNVQLFFNPNLGSFDASNADCEALDPEGHLAIPSDGAFFERMTNFLEALSNRSTDTFIGLRDFREEGGLSTARFQTVNGDVLEFYNVGVNNFPWDPNEPNDLAGVQRCATILTGGTQLMDDNNCINELQSLCQRPCIIDGPTNSPTAFPTFNPTKIPTVSPTQNPSSSPSFTPTGSPTQSPTNQPTAFTNDPTVSPTKAPTSSCVNNYEFFPITEPNAFAQADLACRDLGGRLTIPRSIDWLNDFDIFFNQIGRITSWIGLRDFDDIGGNLVANRFLDVERRPNPFSSRAQVIPWQPTEPNDDSGVENCAEIRDNALLNDVSCNDRNIAVCERYCGELPDNFAFDRCINGVQLFFNPNLRTFDAANADCEAFDPSAHLAIPTDEDFFERMRNFLLLTPGRVTNTFIGLRDFAADGGASTARFRTLNDEVLEFYNVGVGNFPWAVDEPNDSGGLQDCATMLLNGALLMDDEICLATFQSICQRPCDTPDCDPIVSNPSNIKPDCKFGKTGKLS